MAGRFEYLAGTLAVLMTFGIAEDVQGQLYSVGLEATQTEHRLLRLDPATGGVTEVGAPFASCCNSGPVDAIDHERGTLFFVAGDSANTTRVYAVDLVSGVVVQSPEPPQLGLYYTLEYDVGSGKLLTIYAAPFQWIFAAIDPATGERTNLGGLPSASNVVLDGSTIVPAAARFYVLASDSPSDRLYGLSTTTGEVVSNVPLPSEARAVGLEFDDRSGNLYLLYASGLTLHLGIVDPSTGEITPLGTGMPNCCELYGLIAFDDSAGVVHFAGRRWPSLVGPPPLRLFSIDVSTGSLISDPELTEGYEGVSILEYWQKGLLFADGFESGGLGNWSISVP